MKQKKNIDVQLHCSIFFFLNQFFPPFLFCIYATSEIAYLFINQASLLFKIDKYNYQTNLPAIIFFLYYWRENLKKFLFNFFDSVLLDLYWIGLSFTVLNICCLYCGYVIYGTIHLSFKKQLIIVIQPCYIFCWDQWMFISFWPNNSIEIVISKTNDCFDIYDLFCVQSLLCIDLWCH